jgi:hypothetical protein
MGSLEGDMSRKDVGLLVLAVLVMLAFFYLMVYADDKFSAACRAKGGEPHHVGHGLNTTGLCLAPGTIVK